MFNSIQEIQGSNLHTYFQRMLQLTSSAAKSRQWLVLPRNVLFTHFLHVPGCSGTEIKEKGGSLDTAPLGLSPCWFSHSLFSQLNTAAYLIFWHPPFPIHCPSALSQLCPWSQATTALCCHPGCHGRKGPWGPLGCYIAPVCIFVLFLTVSFSVYWLVSKHVLWKVNTWRTSVYTTLIAVIKQIIKQMMQQRRKNLLTSQINSN